MGNRKQVQRILFKILLRVLKVGRVGSHEKAVGLQAGGWIIPDPDRTGSYLCTQKANTFIAELSVLEHDALGRKLKKREAV